MRGVERERERERERGKREGTHGLCTARNSYGEQEDDRARDADRRKHTRETEGGAERQQHSTRITEWRAYRRDATRELS
jgi:hypothetical protein